MIVFRRGPSGVGDPEMNDSERRHAAHVMFGTVRQTDYSDPNNPTVRVAIGDEDDEDGHLLTGWLSMGGGRAGGDSEWHPLEENERVVVLSESGEVQNGIVIPAAFYNSDYPAPGDKAGLWRKKFKDGAVIEYDRDSGEFKIDAKSKVTLSVSSISLVIDSSSITMTAGGVSFKLNGDGIAISGGSITHDGHAIDKTHEHTEVEPGGGLSGPPA